MAHAQLTCVLGEAFEVVVWPRREDVGLLHETLLHRLESVDDDHEARPHVHAVHVAVLLPPLLDRDVALLAQEGQDPEEGDAPGPRGQAQRRRRPRVLGGERQGEEDGAED